MRILEYLIILSLCFLLYFLLYKKDRNSFLYTLFGAIVITFIHFFTEASRWQMIPSYYLLVVMFVIYKWIENKESLFLKVGMFIWLGVAGFLPWVIPVFSLPVPDGPYHVGSKTFHWVDSTRLEWFTPANNSDVREIMAQVWYPTGSQTAHKYLPYFDHASQRAKTLSAAGGLPPFFANHLGLITTNSMIDVPVISTPDKKPVVIVSHGITGARYLHTSLNEHLASRGFFVFGLDHPFDANLTIFPDGRIADYRSDLTNNPDSIQIRKMQMNTRTKDILFIMDQIEKLESGEIQSPFDHQIDLDKIGVLGHSYGGATAINASAKDERIKAVFALDGWINPLPDETILNGISTPFYYLGRPSWENSDYKNNYELLDDLLSKNRSNQMYSILKETEHLDFTDTPLFSPLTPYFLDVGSLPSKISQSIIRIEVIDFFTHFLNNRSGKFSISKNEYITIKSRGINFRHD